MGNIIINFKMKIMVILLKKRIKYNETWPNKRVEPTRPREEAAMMAQDLGLIKRHHCGGGRAAHPSVKCAKRGFSEITRIGG